MNPKLHPKKTPRKKFMHSIHPLTASLHRFLNFKLNKWFHLNFLFENSTTKYCISSLIDVLRGCVPASQAEGD